MKTVAFIPVRGGSKSIPRKNIKLLAGRPLVYWAMDAAVGSKYIDEVVISTDDAEIASIVQNYGSSKVRVVGRSAESSTDTASTEMVMLEYADANEFDQMVLIQATSPLIESVHLDEGICKYFDKSYDSLLSVVVQKRFIWTNRGSDVNIPWNYNPASRPRRQDFDGYYVENGAFYITNRDGLMKSRSRLCGKIGLYEMPENTFVEIDEPSDWLLVENLLKRKRLLGNKNIKILFTDVDGTLTDGGMYYSTSGEELKRYNTRDGFAFSLLRSRGILTVIITSENISVNEKRGLKVKADYVFQGVSKKLQLVQDLLMQLGISSEHAAYIGDDLNDLDCIRGLLLTACPQDSHQSVKDAASYICQKKGGEGAVREFVEWLIGDVG
jgi:N-acylneuraminate cytidylyltransferase